MAEVTESQVLDALRNIIDPDLGKNLVDLGFVKEVDIRGRDVSVTIELTTPACPARERFKEEAIRHLHAIPGVDSVDVRLTARVRPTGSVRREALLPGVKNVVPIASGKGGVGKSTVAVNLALAMSRTGASVGLLDADVFGPSVPRIMGIKDPVMIRDGRFLPVGRHGIRVISSDSMFPPGRAAILRGPMLHKIMEQFLVRTEWGELDYLIVDLPPGTGDIHLSLCQMIPVTGAVVVSTPQDVALNVAEKALFMFRQLRTPVLGMIENMSHFTCRHGEKHYIFGKGGAERYCRKRGLPFLGAIPLDTTIREASDAGDPLVESAPESASAQAYVRVARNLAAQISIHGMAGADGGAAAPKIRPSSREKIVLEWPDGHVSSYEPLRLRCACTCAECVDETTGTRIVRDEAIDRDIVAESISPVGRYGLEIRWSDGHSMGIYTYDRLRRLCDCRECRAEVATEPGTPDQSSRR